MRAFRNTSHENAPRSSASLAHDACYVEAVALRRIAALRGCGMNWALTMRRGGITRGGGMKPKARAFAKTFLGAFAGIAAIALTLSACGPQTAEPLSAFDGRVEDWTREILGDSPELATQAGVSIETAGAPFDNRLDDRSPTAWETRRTAALRRLAELRALDAGPPG